MPTTYDLSPRDVALYQRSNEYLSRLNALDPYSREYANVYNDYVDTIDQLSNRDFRASLGSTLLEFAPITRPRVQARAVNQQRGLSSMFSDSPEPTAQGLALMQQVAPNSAIEPHTQEVSAQTVPDEPTIYQNRNAQPVPFASAKNIAASRLPYAGTYPAYPSIIYDTHIRNAPFAEKAKTLQKMYTKNKDKLLSSGIEVSNLSPSFGLISPYTSPYARALARLSWLDEGI